MRNIDGAGHHPDKVQPGEDSPIGVESFDEQLARTRETLTRTQGELLNNMVQIIYELGRLRGIVEERNRQEAAG